MQMPDDVVSAAESWSYVAVRFTTFTSLVVMIGSIVFVSWVLPRLARANHSTVADALHARTRVLGLGASVALVALAASRVAMQQSVLTQELGGGVPIDMADVMAGAWGAGVVLQLLGGIAGAVTFSRALPAPLGAIARGVALAAAISPALSGHAAGEESPWLPIAADTVHVVAAGAWVGMLAALVLVAFPILAGRDTDEASGARVRALLAAFSPVALSSAALLVVTGTYASWLHLATVDALWKSRYGIVLTRKLVLFIAMLALGALNWRRLGPGVGEPGGIRRLARASWIELLVALGILLATAVLVARGTPADMT